MSSVREDIISVAAEVLGIAPNEVTDGTRVNADQLNTIGMMVTFKKGRFIALDFERMKTVGSLIPTQKEG